MNNFIMYEIYCLISLFYKDTISHAENTLHRSFFIKAHNHIRKFMFIS